MRLRFPATALPVGVFCLLSLVASAQPPAQKVTTTTTTSTEPEKKAAALPADSNSEGSVTVGGKAIARHKAEVALGPKFNIRAFHDAVLETGSVPLPVLEEHIDAFIAKGGSGPYPDMER